MKPFGSDLTHLFHEAVKCNSKKSVRTILDTAESMCIDDEEVVAQLNEFKKKYSITFNILSQLN